jgi:rare lipoprotein A
MTDVRTRARARTLAIILMSGATLAACATPQPKFAAKFPAAGPTPGALPNGAGGRYKVGEPYQVAGVWYVPKEEPSYDQEGMAGFYGADYHLKATSNGEVFDKFALSGAHTTLPLPSLVEVTNLENGRSVQVRINDRGPFTGGRLIDVSQEAARQLGFEQQGQARVRVRYVGPAPLGAPDPGLRHASYTQTPAPGGLPAVPMPYAGLAPKTAPSAAPVGSAPLAPIGTTASVVPAMTAAAPTGVYRVQAGAFSDQANAQRVVSQLSGAGAATIEPIQRADGVTLYRVVLAAGADEGEAWTLRDRVASYGFAEARVVRPF